MVVVTSESTQLIDTRDDPSTIKLRLATCDVKPDTAKSIDFRSASRWPRLAAMTKDILRSIPVQAAADWETQVKVSDILERKGSVVISIGPSESMAALSRLLRDKRIGAVVVSSDGQKIEGVISERDIAYGLGVHTAEMHALPVSALMTKTVITCKPDDNIALVASTMLSRNVRHLPVEDDGRLLGMISIRDVLNFRVDELQQQTALLRTFVHQSNQAPQDRE